MISYEGIDAASLIHGTRAFGMGRLYNKIRLDTKTQTFGGQLYDRDASVGVGVAACGVDALRAKGA